MPWSQQEVDKAITEIKELPAFCTDYKNEFLPIFPGTISSAVDIITRIQEFVPQDLDTPHVTTDGDGAVLLEWWVGTRKLSVYITNVHRHPNTHSKYLKIWGPNMETEMEEGNIQDIATVQECWKWLLSDDEEKGKTLAEVFKDSDEAFFDTDVDLNWIKNL